jgi:type II secretory ATPase GspE/PulE/Tfp pilus assembly ATPase PilB-like protein
VIDFLGNHPKLLDKVTASGREVRYELFVDSGQKKLGGKLSFELSKNVGCAKCDQTGYKGRMGIFEVMEVNDQIGDMIVSKSSEEEIDKTAKSLGMLSMHQDGLMKAIMGLTTLEEIMRVTKD